MTRARDIADGLGAESGEVVPHIKLDILYPAVAGKDLSGTALGGSYVYGNAHSDGRKYYYTDIKGSKPIKDPRIGAYFGSQRHKFKSLQLLEQETATHGKDIFSIDGREWIRAYSTGGGWNEVNDSAGTYIRADDNATGCFLEITGYFNDINFMVYCWTNRVDDIDISVNGTLSVDGSTTLGGDTTAETPLASRFVDASSVINGGSTLSASLGTTPKINTIRYEAKTGSSEYLGIMGIELIAQDTTSTANKSKIQIPAQTVISYGKKHSISATAQHYDPFNGFTSGSDISGYIDEATSLGMSNWKVSSTWYRPFNGGRVVKWIDSSGNIKTSVTMMPPNAQNISGTASNAINLASSQTNDDTINFNTSAIDHSLSEVAKTFHWREFGNGGANQSTGGTYADASMLSGTSDDIAYVMDDGLTSLSGDDVSLGDSGSVVNCLIHAGNSDTFYLNFIGIGFGYKLYSNGTGSDEYDKWVDGIQVVDGNIARVTSTFYRETLAQNLSYGTHVIRIDRTSADVFNELYKEFTFYQPKMPPVPVEDGAVIIADYMLMADFVKQSADGTQYISKGVRRVSCSRDVFYDEDTNASLNHHINVASPTGFDMNISGSISSGTMSGQLPYFGTDFVWLNHDCADRIDTITEYINSTSLGTRTNTGSGDGSFVTHANSPVLGLNGVKGASTSGLFHLNAIDVATPIHTSSHYSEFEDHLLSTLVGGDRNMEQTNLVVSPSGETWDKVTRDTSYIGNRCYSATADTVFNSSSDIVVFDRVRGIEATAKREFFNKDFAIAYNRLICLVDGQYTVRLTQLSYSGYSSTTSLSLRKNGTIYLHAYHDNIDYITYGYSTSINLIRGDYLEVQGIWHDGMPYSQFQIDRIG